MIALELPHLRTPQLPPLAAGRLYIIGDSLSAGIDSGHPPWPRVFADRYRAAVANLARAGIVTRDALAMTRGVQDPDSVTLVEIGGNDLLSGTPAPDFARDLERLLADLRPRTRALVMVELPLLPWTIEYGRAQRRLAARHGVTLIPKRRLAAILGGASATEDGLHLSAQGAAQMAALVHEVVGPALRPDPEGRYTAADLLMPRGASSAPGR